jgi:hypothetical protein
VARSDRLPGCGVFIWGCGPNLPFSTGHHLPKPTNNLHHIRRCDHDSIRSHEHNFAVHYHDEKVDVNA